MARKRTLHEIDQEIAKLQQEANAIREAEKADVVARIKEAVAYYGLTAADLGLARSAKRGNKVASSLKSATKAKRAVAPATRVKFQDGAGNTWSGVGRQPKWFVEALAAGNSADALRA